MTEPSTSAALSARLATEADLPFIVHGAHELAALEQGDSGLPLKPDFDQRLESYFRNLLNTPAALLLIAERNGAPLAFIAGSLQPMPNDFTEVVLYGLIQVLWVEPDARRLRLGHTMLEMFEETLRAQGVSHVDAQHAHSNLPAASFWRNSGYNPVSISVRKQL